MHRIREIKLPFIYFYLFGQTSFIPLKGGQFKKLLAISFIPKFVNFSVIFLSIYFGITQNSKWPDDFDFSTILLLSILIFNCISSLLALYSSLFSPFASQTICEMFASIIQYTERTFSISFSLHRFQKKIHKTILLAILVEFVSGFSRTIYVPSRILKPLANVFVSLLLLYKVLVMLNIQLFIELIHLVLLSLNKKLESVTKTRWHRYSVSCTFQRIKWIHYNLWKISRIIVHSYGWVLVFWIIETCTHFCLGVYWTFMYMESFDKVHLTYFISNYVDIMNSPLFIVVFS